MIYVFALYVRVQFVFLLSCTVAMKRPSEQIMTLYVFIKSAIELNNTGAVHHLITQVNLPISAKEESNQSCFTPATRMKAPQYRQGHEHDIKIYNDTEQGNS